MSRISVVAFAAFLAIISMSEGEFATQMPQMYLTVICLLGALSACVCFVQGVTLFILWPQAWVWEALAWSLAAGASRRRAGGLESWSGAWSSFPRLLTVRTLRLCESLSFRPHTRAFARAGSVDPLCKQQSRLTTYRLLLNYLINHKKQWIETQASRKTEKPLCLVWRVGCCIWGWFYSPGDLSSCCWACDIISDHVSLHL